MSSDHLLVDVRDRVAYLTLNRPQARNAPVPELISDLIGALQRADADPAIKCIAVRGAGEHFSAGGDIKGFSALLATPIDERRDLFERKVLVGDRLPHTMLKAAKPIVAIVQGAVAGAGLGVALAADITVCGRSAHFTAAHVNIGLAVDCGVGAFLVATVGIKRAMRMALTGERVGAEEALALRMVSEVVDDAALDDAAERVLSRLRAGPATAMQAIKTQLNDVAYADLDAALNAEARAVGACAATLDFERGLEAVLARRPALFA